MINDRKDTPVSWIWVSIGITHVVVCVDTGIVFGMDVETEKLRNALPPPERGRKYWVVSILISNVHRIDSSFTVVATGANGRGFDELSAADDEFKRRSRSDARIEPDGEIADRLNRIGRTQKRPVGGRR